MSDYSNDTAYHRPVMLAQCLAALDLQPDGRYVDVTFGGGGHSVRILEKLTTGHLYSFDQDADAEAEGRKRVEAGGIGMEGPLPYTVRTI